MQELREDRQIALIDVLEGVSPDYAVVAAKPGGNLAALDALLSAHHGMSRHELAQRFEGRLQEFPAALSMLAAKFDLLDEKLGSLFPIVQRSGDRVQQIEDLLDAKSDSLFPVAQRLSDRIQQIENRLASFDARIDGLSRSLDDASAEVARVRAAVVEFGGRIARAEAFVDYVSQRKLLERMFFRLDRRPIKPLRRLLFDASGQPRPLFRGVVLHKNGAPRRAFARWLRSETHRPLSIPELSETGAAALDELRSSTSNAKLEDVVSLGQMSDGPWSACFVLAIVSSDKAALDRSIQSVLRQTDPTWELLLVSEKSNAELARAWLDIDWRIRHIESDVSDLPSIAKFATNGFLVCLRQGDTIDDDYILFLIKRTKELSSDFSCIRPSLFR